MRSHTTHTQIVASVSHKNRQLRIESIANRMANLISDFSFSLTDGQFVVYFVLFDEKNEHVLYNVYSRIHPQKFNRLLYCFLKCFTKGILLNANFRLNSSAKKGMMFVSKVQHFTLININKMVVTLIGEQLFFSFVIFSFFLVFFSIPLLFGSLCVALLFFTLLCSALLLCCIITKVIFFHTKPLHSTFDPYSAQLWSHNVWCGE